VLEVASYHCTYCVHEHSWHINGEHYKRHERDFLIIVVTNSIELSKQVEVPLLYEGVEPHTEPREVNSTQKVMKDLGSHATFCYVQ
jgi:hypothetical protein